MKPAALTLLTLVLAIGSAWRETFAREAGVDPPAQGADGAASPTASALAIEGLTLTESRFGPPRAGRKYVIGERLCARFAVRGAGSDASGLLRLRLRVGVGRAVPVEQELEAADLFGARSLPFAFSFPIGPGAAVGEHELVVEVEDAERGGRAAVRQRIEIGLPAGLTSLNPYFASDEAGRYERSAEFVVGEAVRLFFGVVGLARSGECVRLSGDLEVLEEETDRVLTRRERALLLEAPAAPGVAVLDASLVATATRPGRFRFRVLVRDLNSGEGACLERAFAVREP